MKVPLVYFSVIERTETPSEVDIERGASVAQLLEAAGYPSAMIDFGGAFPVRDEFCSHNQSFPFVLTEQGLRWGARFSETSVEDARRTLGLGDRPVRLQVHIPQAGGPDLLDVAVVWQRFHQAIEATDPYFGVGGGLLGAIAYLRERLRRRKAAEPPKALAGIGPAPVFSLVMHEQEWDAGVLADVAGITREDAVSLLKLCRYRWNASARLYRRSPDTDRIIAALNGVKQHE